MRKLEKEAEKRALQSSSTNEPAFVAGFIHGAEHYIKLCAKEMQLYSEKAFKALKNEDPEKPLTEAEKVGLREKMEIGRIVSAKMMKILEEEVD